METPRGVRPAASATLVAGLFLVCVFAVDPRGQFPLNDDWAYTRTAFALGSGQGLKVDEWSAPSLIGQALYGALVVRVAGEDFTALRLSTVALSAASLWLLCRLFSRAGVPGSLIAAAGAAWALNPVGFCLSLTFMTEIPFLFFVVVGVCLLLRNGDGPRGPGLVFAGAAFGYAFLIRQTSLLFLGPAAALPFLAGTEGSLRGRANKALRIVIPGAALIGGYCLWLLRNGGLTPAARRKFELLQHLSGEQVVGNALGIFFYMSFFLIPVWLIVLPKVVALGRRARPLQRWAVPVLWASVALGGLAWFRINYGGDEYLPSGAFHAQMPFLLNVLYDSGLGPVTLDPTYYVGPPTPRYPGAWAVVTLLTAAGTVVLGCFVTWTLQILGARNVRRRPMLVFGLAGFASVLAFEILFSHLQEGGLFDRHLLTALLPLLLIVADCARVEPPRDAPRGPAGHRFAAAAAVAAALGMAWFSVAATHDYFEWSRLRWSLGTELLASGVISLHGSGGCEFNAWHNYDTFRGRGNVGKVYYWWYDRRDYLIAMSVPEGYAPIRTATFGSWLHGRAVALHVLRKL